MKEEKDSKKMTTVFKAGLYNKWKSNFSVSLIPKLIFSEYFCFINSGCDCHRCLFYRGTPNTLVEVDEEKVLY